MSSLPRFLVLCAFPQSGDAVKIQARVLAIAGLICLAAVLPASIHAQGQIANGINRGQAGPSEIRTGVYRSRPVTYNVRNGQNIFEGDILLEKVEPILDPMTVVPGSVAVAYPGSLWPKVGSVFQVPYIITTGAADLSAAITRFNNTFTGLIQFVPRGTQTDYVNFNFNPSDFSGTCESFVGRIGHEQQIGGSASCNTGTILHEMGHTIGLWHEQSRSDRDTYVNVMFNNIIKGSGSNFDQLLDNAQNLTLYDYASVMHYIPFAFSRNGGPTIESIPAGVPLSNLVGYTSGDIDAIMRLYGSVPTAVTVTTNPPGLQVIVDGTPITTPQAFNWSLNSTHTLNVSTGAQTISGVTYIYGRWNDDPAANHSITVVPGDGRVAVPATSPAVTVYTANFIELVGFNPLVSPAASGTMMQNPAPISVSGAVGKFYVARQPVTFAASPAAGNNFYEWWSYLPGALSSNPKTVYMESQPPSIDVTAAFTPNAVTTITANPADPSAVGVLVDGGFWYAPKNFSAFYDSGWTAGSTHSIKVDSPQLPHSINTRYTFTGWSDGGAQTHNITVPAGNSVFSAAFTPQYAAIENVPASCAGSISAAPPSPTNDSFYSTGSHVSFTETTNAGWTFTEWMNDLSGQTNPQTLTISDEALVTADFNTASVPLTVSGLIPPNAIAGNPSFTLTINGTGFTSNSIVFVNGTFRNGSTFVNSTQLTVPITAADIATAGAFQVDVENFPNGAVCGVFAPKTFFVLLNNKIGTLTTVSSSLNPSTFGQPVTFTATVTPAKPGTPTGIVTFKNGSTTLGSGVLNGSLHATFTTSTLGAGAHSITAVYAGDSNFTMSTSSALTQTVNKTASATTLTSSQNPSSFNQAVTFTATVKSSTSGTPTGVATFKDGTTTLGTGTLNSSGAATFKTSVLGVGTHSITSAYGGDANFLTSTSSSLAQAVNKAASTTTLASSKNPSTVKQAVTFTATVKSSTSGTPTGIVNFKDSASTIGTVNLDSSGKATFTTSALSAGTHSITGIYPGDTNFVTSTSSVLKQTVNKAATTTALASTQNPSTFGQAVKFTATVKSSTAGTLSGSVAFKDGATMLGTGTLNSGGVATFTTATLSAGSHSITGVYSGDAIFAVSTSSVLKQTVNKAATTTTLVSSLNPSKFNQGVTFTAAVKSATTGTLSGSVTFKDGTATLGSGSLNLSGMATFKTSTLAVGTHSITAIFSGNTNFAGSTSAGLVQVVHP
jgi:astacin (peptidase family M12A)/Big-like domain-containing protein